MSVDGIDPKTTVFSVCRKNGVFLSDDQWATLSQFVSALLEWNKKINLISRRDEENVWISHILHSLSPLFCLDFAHSMQILDLGSGGGLPGIPLAIAQPSAQVTLLDSIRKKTMVMQDIVSAIGMTNVVVATGRAEEVGTEQKYAGRFDTVVVRAVGPLVDVIRWARPFLRKRNKGSAPLPRAEGGTRQNAPRVLVYKGGAVDTEIAAARTKIPGLTITVINMTFDAIVDPGLTDKKLVLVNF
jgi:16S rRNA (guanine527-N7)-methyltransferase